MLLREPPQGFAMIGNHALVDDFALRVERANGVLLVAEVDSDGDGWNDVFHGSYECITALKRRPLPSHLILLGFFSPSVERTNQATDSPNKQGQTIKHWVRVRCEVRKIRTPDNGDKVPKVDTEQPNEGSEKCGANRVDKDRARGKKMHSRGHDKKADWGDDQ